MQKKSLKNYNCCHGCKYRYTFKKNEAFTKEKFAEEETITLSTGFTIPDFCNNICCIPGAILFFPHFS
jgi:hypothetical protein